MQHAHAHHLRSAALPVSAGLISRRARAAARSFVGERPAIAWSMALLFLFKGVICITVAAFSISYAEPVAVVGATGTLGIAAAVVVWFAAKRINLLGFELLAASGSILTSALIARASTPGGLMIGALSYTWVSIYAASFFPRRAILVQGVLISAGFAGGLLADGLSRGGLYWVVVSTTNWSICLLL